MINYNLPYHVIEEDDEGNYTPCLSFGKYEEAIEFIKFAPGNLLIVTKEELEDYIEINSK